MNLYFLLLRNNNNYSDDEYSDEYEASDCIE